MDNLPGVLTTSDVMRLFRVSRIAVRRWCKSGRLPYTRINKRGDKRYLKKDILRVFREEGGERE